MTTFMDVHNMLNIANSKIRRKMYDRSKTKKVRCLDVSRLVDSKGLGHS